MSGATQDKIGSSVCQILCEEMVWSQAEVDLFQKLVAENYGYRMYLDDLPSGVALGKGDTLYEENVPVGYFPYVST